MFRITAAALAFAFACLTTTPAEACYRRVYVFSAHWCPACKRMEAMLDANGVPYERIETSRNTAAQAFMNRNFGGTAIPVIVVDNNYEVGFNEGWVRRRLCL